jgi:hypothetical protein
MEPEEYQENNSYSLDVNAEESGYTSDLGQEMLQRALILKAYEFKRPVEHIAIILNLSEEVVRKTIDEYGAENEKEEGSTL